MSFNLPTVNTTNISFGPARVFLGPSGATPTIDVGAIGEDGVTFEYQREVRDIKQGNPQLIEYPFVTSQGFRVSWTALEYDVTNMGHLLGSGVTSTSVAAHTYSFGGDPLVELVSVLVQHQMAVGSDTLNISVWKARGDGNLSVAMAMEEHKQAMAFQAIRSSTNWGGAALGSTVQLVQLVIVKV